MKNFKLAIIFLIVIIILIITMIIFLIKKDQHDNPESDFADTEFENIDNYEVQPEIIKVENRNKYYAVEKILNTYIIDIKEMKGIIDFQKYDDIEVKDDGVNRLYNILDFEYISDMNLKKEELQHKIKEYSDYNLEIKSMYIYEMTSSINLYFVNFMIDDDNQDLLIKTDSKNMTFSVFLDDYISQKSYGIDMETKNIKISNKELEKNDYNQYKYVNITDEYMAVQYINSLKEKLNNDLKYVYDNLLEERYREKRFGNINNFITYINDNIDVLKDIQPSKFTVNYYDNYTEYVCMDQYNNYYIFKENAVMDYTFMLDTYTIMTEKFKKSYETASDEKKVQMNIDKFIEMINRHDYKSSYNCIAKSFKSNYFNTQEDFEDYINDKFFTFNKYEFKDYQQKGENVYVYTIKLTDYTQDTNETRNLDIIMRLNDDFDFEMSFVM